MAACRGPRCAPLRIASRPIATIPEWNHTGRSSVEIRCGSDHRHMGRKRLRRRQLFALGATLRHGAFLHRPYRLAGVAVEHEHKALLGRLDHDIAHALAGIDARQRRLRRQIVIPDVVVHGLIRPDSTRPSLRAVLRPNWRARCCRAACRPRNPGSATTSARIPGRALRPPTSVPRHWRDRRSTPSWSQRIEAPARLPVRASKARTAPGGASTRRLSAIAEPTMTPPLTTTGADVIWNSPGHSSGPVSSLTSPLVPKSAQGMPVLASSAITRTSLVPMKMRARQAAVSVARRRPNR